MTSPHASLTDAEPSLSSYKSVVYIDEGEELTIQVAFEGSPSPSITWFFNGMRLSDDGIEDGREVTDDGSLYIHKVQRNHAGTYDFIVSNTSGSVEGCTKLIIYLIDRNFVRGCGPSKICSNPVKQEVFGEHVARYHENGDMGFSDEFEVIYIMFTQSCYSYDFFLEQHLISGEVGQKALIGRTPTNRHFNRFKNILCCELNNNASFESHKYAVVDDMHGFC